MNSQPDSLSSLAWAVNTVLNGSWAGATVGFYKIHLSKKNLLNIDAMTMSLNNFRNIIDKGPLSVNAKPLLSLIDKKTCLQSDLFDKMYLLKVWEFN